MQSSNFRFEIDRAPAAVNGRLIVNELLQMAEEASELSQASLKLARALGAGYRTPKDVKTCTVELAEEMADVLSSIDMWYRLYKANGGKEDIANLISKFIIDKDERFVARQSKAY